MIFHRHDKEAHMELHMHSHRFVHRLPDWRAAAYAGLAAGVVYMVMELLTARFVLYQSAWGTVKMVAAIMLGSGMLNSADSFSWIVVLAAAIVHFGLSVVMGVALAMLIAAFQLDSGLGMVSLTGAVFGVGAYLLNFYVFTSYFNWFDKARGQESLLAHIVFGLVAAIAYWQLERRATAASAEPGRT